MDVGQNRSMKITYPDGTAVDAILLSRSPEVLRFAVSGDDDARMLTLNNGSWTSENGLAVTIEFEWEGPRLNKVPTIAECVCSKQLASRLIAELVSPDRDLLEEELIYVFTGQGDRISVQQSELVIH